MSSSDYVCWCLGDYCMLLLFVVYDFKLVRFENNCILFDEDEHCIISGHEINTIIEHLLFGHCKCLV